MWILDQYLLSSQDDVDDDVEEEGGEKIGSKWKRKLKGIIE